MQRKEGVTITLSKEGRGTIIVPAPGDQITHVHLIFSFGTLTSSRRGCLRARQDAASARHDDFYKATAAD